MGVLKAKSSRHNSMSVHTKLFEINATKYGNPFFMSIVGPSSSLHQFELRDTR